MATTPSSKEWRTAIFNKIVNYIQASAGDEEQFQAMLWKDYVCWTAWHFDGEKYPLMLTKKQYQMFRNFYKYDVNTWLVQRRGGKCKPLNTRVQLADGTITSLGEIEIGERVVSLNESSGHMESDIVTNKWMTGSKECFEMKLDGNFYTTATAEHQFLTSDGWLQLKDITTDHYVAIPTKVNVAPTGNLKPHEAKLLAAWIAEGTKKAQTYAWTNGNDEIVTEIARCATLMGWKHNKLSSPYHYSITRDVNRQTPRRWLDQMGLMGCTTWGAYVPDCVFAASDESVAAFLNIYAGTDGYVDAHKGMVGFCSRSRRLCEDIRTLLLRFGIPSMIREHMINWRGSIAPTYETQIMGAEYFTAFAEKIGVAGKMDKVRAALKIIEKRTYQQTRFSKIPTSTWNREVTYGDVGCATGYFLMSARAYPTSQRAKAQTIYNESKNTTLGHLLAPDVAWMKVKSIASVGVQETCDIEVTKNHNFIGDNVITHNSVSCAVIVLYYAMTNNNKKVLLFAPTEEQLVVMASVRTLLGQESASALYKQFIGENVIKSKASNGEDDSLNKLGSVFNQKYIRLLNGSDITAVTLNVAKGGSSRRGFSANVIFVDEFQDVPPEMRGEIIEPIIMDAFSDEKRLVYVGTPHTKVDRKLDLFWDAAKKNDGEGTLHSHCWEAVNEGIRTPKKMANRFSKLNIPCRWVLKTGICPVYLPKMFTEKTGQAVEIDERGFGKIPCGKICMDNSTFVMEDLAQFSSDIGMAIPPEWIRACGKEYEMVHSVDLPTLLGRKLVLSVDIGDISADCQICLWEVLTHMDEAGLQSTKLRMVYQEVVVDPQTIGMKNPAMKRIKEIWHMCQPQVVCVDVTGKKEIAMELIMEMHDGSRPIPRHVFLTNETAKNNNIVGNWTSGPEKAVQFENMREMVRLSRLEFPLTDIVVFDKIFNELISLAPQSPTMTRPYSLWKTSDGKSTLHMTDAVTLAALYLKDLMLVPASTDFSFFSIGGPMTDSDD